MQQEGTIAGASIVHALAALVVMTLSFAHSGLLHAEEQGADPGSSEALGAAADWIERCRLPTGADSRYCVVCISAGGSNSSNNNAPSFCLASDINMNSVGEASFSGANGVPLTGLNYVQSREVPASTQQTDGAGLVRCKSTLGSEVAAEAGNDACLTADLRLTNGVPAAFALAHGLAVKSLQFMQVSFRNNSLTSASAANVPLNGGGSTACVSASGSRALTGGGGFCLASNLVTSVTGLAGFTFANEFPVSGVQFLQVNLDDSALGTLSHAPAREAGAACRSKKGTSATSGPSSGFCLVSDLTTGSADLASFAFANKFPLKGLQFLQITFADDADRNLDGQFYGGDSSSEGNCVSTRGSTATTGTQAGFCLASDLSPTQGDFAEITIANGLPAASMQFLQATFSKDSLLAETTAPTERAEIVDTARCLSSGGTQAAADNSAGFCIAADRGKVDKGLANLALANDLPISALQFLQLPLGIGNADSKTTTTQRPRGMIIAEVAKRRADRMYRPALASGGMRIPRYYSFSGQRQILREYPSLQPSLPRTLAFWINRTLKSSR